MTTKNPHINRIRDYDPATGKKLERGDGPASTTSPKRTRGGQPGNKNSLKHGFYAIPTEVLSRLQTDAKGEGVDEIELLQSLIDDTVKIYRATPNKNLEQSQTTLRCVSQAVDSIKGQRLMQGALYSNQTTIEKALEELASIPPEED
jgi:hypothetical protein